MEVNMLTFPDHFVFGSATAGHQIEGDNVHCQEWHDELHDERRKAAGKGAGGKACHHRELYRQDVDLIADPGHQAYRFSIEWSRIEPRPGRRDDDSERRRYVALRLAAVHEAVRLGVGVRGYLYWSMMDNFEWGSFVPRFGPVHVGFHTYQRTPKPSAFFYRNIIRARGLDSESARGITAVAGKASE